jgi:Cu+-exporting ATPase
MSDSKQHYEISVGGMTCTNCAMTVQQYLEKKGLEDVNVNFATSEVSFNSSKPVDLDVLYSGIRKLGYQPRHEGDGHDHTDHEHEHTGIEKKFYFCLAFTIPLVAHMFLPFDILHHPLLQLALCLPVMIVGVMHFGRSAFYSLKAGVPNMDVLIFMGSFSAFVYSLLGTWLYYGEPGVEQYLFYETAATIITLVLLGNMLESRAVQQTTVSLKELNSMQVRTARKILFDLSSMKEEIIEINYEDIKINDHLAVSEGSKIPVDGEILVGEAQVDEAMITGESMPVFKRKGDHVIGSTMVTGGSFRMKATAVGSDTMLSQIIHMVKNAQASRPNIQKLGDKVSAVFVPVVILIALATFLACFYAFNISLQHSLMRSIAVLVISCPCAMGLATPTAVMVGIGRAARQGVLIKGGATLEELASVNMVVFDKTGTITTGNFRVKEVKNYDVSMEEINNIIYNLELHSTHPIAQSIIKNHKDWYASAIEFEAIKKMKGLGIVAKDKQENSYMLGSEKIGSRLKVNTGADMYLYRNDQLIATLDIEDEVREGTEGLIKALKDSGIKTVLLSGDNAKKCKFIADKLGIDHYYASQLPQDKLRIVTELSKESMLAMVGDGINDAPALSRARIGISLSNSSDIARQSARVILLKGDISSLLFAIRISRHTYTTIKQNLFWAFFYNIVAIPMAILGLLNPMAGALFMAFSDVVVIGNSIRLRTKNIS